MGMWLLQRSIHAIFIVYERSIRPAYSLAAALIAKKVDQVGGDRSGETHSGWRLAIAVLLAAIVYKLLVQMLHLVVWLVLA